VLAVQGQINIFSAISLREQVTFEEIMMMSILY